MATTNIPTLIPSDYAGTSLLSYSHQWRERARQFYQSDTTSNLSSTTTSKATTVFGLAFYLQTITTSSEDQNQWLAGCTSQGEVCIWKLGRAAEFNVCDDDDQEITFESISKTSHVRMTTQPRVRLQISKGVLYSCKIVERTDKVWLVVSGDDGVMILDWAIDVAPHLANASQATATKSNLLVNTTRRRQFAPFPSVSQSSGVEINDCLVSGNFLYGASGDAFGCYKWDLETGTVVTTYHSHKRTGSSTSSGMVGGGYYQTLTDVPGSNLVLMGGESGILNIWDIQSDMYVDAIDVNTKMSTFSNSLAAGPSHKRRMVASAASPNVNETRRWISSCIARDENWWMVAGGCQFRAANQRGQSDNNGFISTFHGPTRSLVATVNTRETPQQLAILRCSSNSQSMDGIACNGSTLLSVANESYVSHWANPFALNSVSPAPQRVWCNQASVYAVAVSADDRHIATGGVGSVVDIFEPGTQSSVQLTLQ